MLSAQKLIVNNSITLNKAQESTTKTGKVSVYDARAERAKAIFRTRATYCAAPRTAHACGGFWCSQTSPVNQSAEQIIFIDNPDETVTAIIQIQYQGPSEKFAWLVPIPGNPL